MTPVQIYEIVNSMAEQSLGMQDLTPTDTTFISIGKKIISSDKNLDAFYKTLVDRIGRTVLAVRTYKAKNPSMAREPFEYGAILQKISFGLAEAQENATWNALGAVKDDPFQEYPTTFMQMFFDKWSAWEVAGTIPDIQLETAFTNAQSMAAFIDGIFQYMNNSLEIAYENVGNLARASLIGSTLNQTGNNVCAVNLLANYNTETGESLTVSSCLRSTEFLKYAAMQMSLFSDRMERPSTLFNPSNWERWTPKDRQVFEVLSEFAKAFDTYLQADTFHNNLTQLNMYESVPYWQGSGTAWDFESTSGIDVTIEVDDGSGNTTSADVNKTGIIAVLRDIDSCGVTIDRRRTKSLYNPHNERTNYWMKAEIGQFRDSSENCIVFYIAEAS